MTLESDAKAVGNSKGASRVSASAGLTRSGTHTHATVPPLNPRLSTLLESIQPHDHLCLIYETKQEWRDAVVPFITIGLRRGEKCLYLMDVTTATEIRGYLEAAGIDVATAERSGQLTVLHYTQAYTREGPFDPDRMIALLIHENEKARAEGYPALRATGEMSWVLHGDVGMDKLLEYEAKLNRDVFPHHRYIGICQYDRSRFDPEVIKGVIMTHPLVVYGSHVYHNFYYVPPEEFLAETHAATEVEHWLANLEADQQQRQSLVASEAQYRSLFEQSHEAIAVIDTAGRALEANQAWLDLFGYTRDELQHITAAEVYVDASERADFKRRMAERGFVRDEVRHKKKDGTVIMCQRSAVAQRDERGNIVAYQTLFQDVTEQKRIQRALSDSEEKFRTLFEQSMDAIYLSTPDGAIVEANRVWLDLFGYTPDDLSSLHAVDMYVEPSDRDDFLRRIAETGHVRDEVRLKRRDGSEFDCDRVVSTVRDESGRVVRFQGVLRDVTEARQAARDLKAYLRKIEEANTRLQEMDSLKSIFLASMSHELRTPLNSIIGFTGVMLMGIAGPLNEEQRKQLTMVKESADHLLRLINDVLDISRIEANRVELAIEEFDFGAVVAEVLRALQPAASTKGLELLSDVPDGIRVRSDRRRIRQVLTNLVGNAVKFTEQGTVRVSTRTPGDGALEVVVIDTGPGIQEEDMRRLFQPFQQVSPLLTRKHEGTGLGLYLTRKLADLLQAEIHASSEYGKGSSFTFTMPLRYEEGR